MKQQKIGKKRDIVETIDDVVNGEEPLKQDTEDFLFIYDDDDFDEIIPEDKKIILDNIDRTDFNSDKQIFNGDEDAIIDNCWRKYWSKKENEQYEINKGEKR